MKQCSKCKEVKELTEFYKSSKSWCIDCRKRWLEETKEQRAATAKKYYLENAEKCKAMCRDYRRRNSEAIKEYERQYSLKRKEINNQRAKERYNNDPIYHMKRNIRNLVKNNFKRGCEGRYEKSKRTEALLGCTIPEFMKHIESLFQEGMSWDNHGYYGWHLDHIVPISSAKTEDDLYKLSHYTNYQPLWMKDNLKKSNKIVE